MAVREGKWKCTYCGAVNLGRDMKCTSCSATRDTNVKFFLEDDASAVSDENLANIARSGADWHCAYCGTDNRAPTEVCRQCGAAKGEGKNREQKIISDDQSENENQVITEGHTANKTAPARNRIPLIAGVSITVVALLVLFWAFFIRTTEQTLTVSSGHWERSIDIEAQEWVLKNDWENQLPKGAEILRTWTEQRSTEKVQTGTERVKTGTKDMGNGFFEDVYEDRPVYEEKPVMDTKVEYRILEWKVVETRQREGKISDEPVWPEVSLSEGQREGQRHETAYLLLSSSESDKDFRYSLKPAELENFETGKSYSAEINALGNIRKLISE